MPERALDFRVHPATHRIVAALVRVADAWRSAVVLAGVARWLACLLFYLAAVTVLEVLVGLGAWLRLLSFATLLGLLFGGGYWFLMKRVVAGFGLLRVAEYVAGRLPEKGEELLAAWHLAKRPLGSSELVDAFLKQTAAALDEGALVSAVDRTHLRKSLRLLLASLLAVPVLVAWHPQFRTALSKSVYPFGFVPRQVAGIRISHVEPGDCVVIAGEAVPVTVTAWCRQSEPPPGKLFYRRGTKVEGEIVRNMQAQAADRPGRFVYSFTMRSVTAQTFYRAEVGSAQTDVYTIRIENYPEAVRVRIEITPPAYTGLPQAVREGASGDVEALAGSLVKLDVFANQPLREAALALFAVAGRDETRLPMEVYTAEPARASGKFELHSSGWYSVDLVNQWGKSNPQPARFRVLALKDAAPLAQIVSPARDIVVATNAEVPLALKASDDVALKSLRLLFRRNAEGEPIEAATFAEAASKKDVAIAYRWRLPPDIFASGDAVTYYLVAEDAIQKSESAPRRLYIKDPAKVRHDTLRYLEKLRAFLEKVLAEEEEHKRQTDKFALAVPSRAEAARFLEALAQAHAGLKERMLSEAAALPQDLPALSGPRRFLEGIAGREATSIIQAVNTLKARYEQLEGVERTQKVQEIALWEAALIKKIRAFLGALGETIAEAERDEREGGDLPQQVTEKLEDLRKKLKGFVKDQKRLVDATSDIAKFAAADLTADEQQALEKLAQAEDSLKKFLEEAYSDFSRLAAQDFSDPVLLKELNEIISDIELAADALERKNVEVAVSLEEAGLEMAEALTTHIEKWLPDTLDNYKWSMEEPLTNPETPMAELPSELEDIIGELTQTEDEMSAENEDVTSAWTDSLDKGAGWGTLDGPISNMSAQGVTGNRLPNESEISGRSGEGRTGKASGELVEDTTTGKGGRRTPTRLSPEPYQEGRINDQSNDPAGGATGGGKVGGAGEEGLEGAPPPNQQDTNQPLTERTASIRNRTERIALELEVAGYPQAVIGEVVANLRALENDVRNGRYQNIAQQREVVLKGLKEAKEWVGALDAAQVDFTRLSPAMRSELFDTAAEKLPEQYDPIVNAYRKAILSIR